MWWPAVVKSEWELRLDYGRSPHAYVNQRLQIQLELLMISGMPLATCWAFNDRWNNKLYYKVASCWLFLLSLSHCFLPVMSLDVNVPAKLFPAAIPVYYSLSPKIVAYFLCLFFFGPGIRGGAVGSGTALQAGRSRVRFPMVQLEFFIDIIPPASRWFWGRLSL